MKHYDVLIATPGAMLEAQYVKSLVETLAECDKRGISYKWLNSYSSLVHHARELTASGITDLNLNPLQTSPGGDNITYSKIFWIDSDISWTTEQFFKIYDSDKDVISGAYLLADGFTTTIHAWGSPGGIPAAEILNMKEPIKVQSIGFGFVAMKSGVFEKIQRPWFNLEYVKVGKSIDGKDIFDSVGEDISWCVKAYKAGIEIYFDPEVLVTHMKKQPITWKHIQTKTNNNTNRFRQRL
jgi:GT2 family glycosyltransferase